MANAKRDLPDFASYCEQACRMEWGEPDEVDSRTGNLHWKDENGDGYGGRVFFPKTRSWYDRKTKQKGSTLELVAFSKGDPVEKLKGRAFVEAWREAHLLRWIDEGPPDNDNKWPPERRAYLYRDESGEPLFEVVRYDTEDKLRRFRQRYNNPAGSPPWIYKKHSRQVLFRLPELASGVERGEIVLLCEGEHDAETAAEVFGFVATSAPGGVDQPWLDSYDEFLRGADVVVVSDNDPHESGQAYARKNADHLVGIASRVRLVVFPQKDLTEWVEAGGTREALDVIIRNAPDHRPSKPNGAAGDPKIATGASARVLFDPWVERVVPDFPLDTLPSAVGDFVGEQSRVIGCDPSAVAICALANFSGAIDHRIRMKMKNHGDWYVWARLWIMLHGDPSTKKTPAMEAALARITRRSFELWEKWQGLVDTIRRDNPAAKDKDLPPPPATFVVNDATTEKLGELLSKQDRGALLCRDELAGWLGGMERYQGGGRASSADRGFWLEAYDGGRYRFDRIKRGTILIRHLSVSVVGGIQPDRLKEMHDFTTDGLLQRFIPVMLRPGGHDLDDLATEKSQAQYEDLTDALLSINPHTLHMTEEAIAEMERERHALHDLMVGAVGLWRGFAGFVGKQAGVTGSLTLILHMLDNWRLGDTALVDVETVRRAVRIVREFIIPHAREFYRTSEAVTDGDRIKKIASYVLTSGKKYIVPSDLSANVPVCRGRSPWEVAQMLAPLVTGGWLIPDDEIAPRRWDVNAAVHEKYRERAEEQRRRNAAVAEAMGAHRKS